MKELLFFKTRKTLHQLLDELMEGRFSEDLPEKIMATCQIYETLLLPAFGVVILGVAYFVTRIFVHKK